MQLRSVAAVVLACGSAATLAHAQTASALVREGDGVSGAPGLTISSIGNSASNGVDGYAFGANATDDANDSFSLFLGNATGGPLQLLRQESTFGTLQQTAFESFFGIADTGDIGYSATVTDTSIPETGLDSAWLSDTLLRIEGDPDALGVQATFNSRVNVTHDGQPYWLGGVDTSGSGTTDIRALFINGLAVLASGDSVVGIPEVISSGSGIDFDTRVSELGSRYITLLDVTSSPANDGVMAINGAAINDAGGNLLREGTPVSAAAGGMGGEDWDNFDFMAVNEAGDFFITGDTNNDSSMDEFVSLNGAIVLREGDSVGGFTLAGSIEGGDMNSQSDWAVIWDGDNTAGDNLEILIVNGEFIIGEGDAVDWNGDGLIDAGDNGAVIDNFTGISSLSIGDRQGDGTFNVAFVADVQFDDGSVLEGGFRITVPTPGAAGLLAVAGLAAVRRRR